MSEILGNRLLEGLSSADQGLLAPNLQRVRFSDETVLFEPGREVCNVCFPGPGTIGSLVLNLRNGLTAEAAMIGVEGALGGVISEGEKPAFARGVVQIGGPALQLSTEALQQAKLRSPSLRDHFSRYADCLLAQLLQSVACNAVHDFDARLARWLLTTQDRIGSRDIRVTQEFISEMLGVRRPYTTRIIGGLERRGAIKRSRGTITITDRRRLEALSCECYGYLKRHFERLLPGVYPVFDG